MNGIGIEEHDQEGRVITAEYEKFYLVTCYTPNSQRELARLEYRMEWEVAFREYLLALDAKKPVILCGDLNVAHQEIDLKNPKTNRKNAGFSDEEREKMTELLAAGFTDTFRYLYPDAVDAYSWWSYMGKARERNVGWRIDYFLVSNSIADKIQEAKIHADIFGSDHCPVELVMDL
ncbi:exodeoxyribonuclease III [Veillonella sp. oral taxon 780 str. F0422]|nr:exodeoxyribonuclease III [Veillonella sp. oral taxon 780 str. F0422]